MKELQHTAARAEQTLIIGVQDETTRDNEAKNLMAELANLANTLGIEVADTMLVKLRERNPALLVGTGKADEIVAAARAAGADSIIFDHTLSPVQQRNLEELAGLSVYDRSELIIKIFASRARTREASLQVELAQLQYSLPRLTHASGDLNRQKGGRYGTKDSGETKLELDRRQIGRHIKEIQDELIELRKVRATQRKRRERVGIPRAAIVGYTNAGKSSLLNRIANADVLAEDKLFATLDPTTRRMNTRSGTLLLTDTVGFVRKLPHRLIEAFKASLEEAADADILVHVLDANDPECDQHYQTTCQVLTEIGVDTDHPIIVYNKIDKLADRSPLDFFARRHPEALFVSVKTGEGLDKLVERIERELSASEQEMDLRVPMADYAFVSLLYREATVLSENHDDEAVLIRARIPQRLVSRAEAYRA
ncbi:MAG: GTPase HflX [Spirochaetes bacterium GWD1_61_31]|nr:MAG: GTPase HflX [Spirochaetes bacterium GWB1_60_80]OHD38063.1 MAG: GTPase HflX [Spirochaetes bacterium GWD1_61_31]OHD44549.1 MAG: GTPase HflX [Spirochaetes bacterium GWE1_60_18]OHD58663.1 MAG: GTPase HflX [Spirochaetes bacterium GWF1_60_12]HAP43206.1 GTPase HflX [Spirochaetaceae bacterium]